jgi:hypothetical protein
MQIGRFDYFIPAAKLKSCSRLKGVQPSNFLHCAIYFGVVSLQLLRNDGALNFEDGCF